MKKLYIIYIALLFIFGCKSNDKKYDSIEILVYVYHRHPMDIDKSIGDHYFSNYYYSIIDENGIARLALDNYLTKWETKYYDFNIDEKIINDLVDTMAYLKPFTVFGYDECHYYRGYYFAIKVNKGNSSKTVKCPIFYYNSNNIFVKFYNHIDSLSKIIRITESKDTILLEKRKDDLIKWSVKTDSFIYPPNEQPMLLPKFYTHKNNKHPKNNPKKD